MDSPSKEVSLKSISFPRILEVRLMLKMPVETQNVELAAAPYSLPAIATPS
jgi:hypothetical protein